MISVCLVCHYVLSCKYRLTRRVNTYAWIRATANSRIVRRRRIINVMVAVGGLIFMSTIVAPPIRCISRCPAVMLAVSRTARAIG